MSVASWRTTRQAEIEPGPSVRGANAAASVRRAMSGSATHSYSKAIPRILIPVRLVSRSPLLAALAFQGFALAINGVAAPWMMESFALDQAGIARAFAWISLSALGAFVLAR